VFDVMFQIPVVVAGIIAARPTTAPRNGASFTGLAYGTWMNAASASERPFSSSQWVNAVSVANSCTRTLLFVPATRATMSPRPVDANRFATAQSVPVFRSTK
jgi:hypothetical protein